MSRYETPDWRSPPSPSIVTVHNAIVPVVVEGKFAAGGVFWPDRRVAPNSRTMIYAHPEALTDIPQFPDTDDYEDLPGRYLFGGPVRRHFGHFLTETIARFWALDHLDAPVQGIVFQGPPPEKHVRGAFRGKQRDIIKALTDDLPFVVGRKPLRVEHLLIPSQGVGHLNWSTGTPEYRNFMRRQCEKHFAAKPDAPEKLYISRRDLARTEKLMDQEHEVEALMRAAGYAIFHPQKHRISDQAAHYMAARVIIGADGSAFYFAAHALRPGTKVGLIKRRHDTKVFNSIAEQIKACAQVEFDTFHPLLPQPDGAETAPINMFRLERALRNKGFL